MESDKLLEQYFPQYYQLKESQQYLVGISILTIVTVIITQFASLDRNGIQFNN